MGGLRIPGLLKHGKGARTDTDMQREVRAHYEAHAGVRFLVDALTALHATPEPLRTAEAFYKKLPAQVTMKALEQRADLRARVVQALTAGPPSLTRRMPPDVVISQIELLVERDLPLEERNVRSEGDRSLTVMEIYLKYLDPIDVAAYVPSRDLWAYESFDTWWERTSPSTRRLMAAEIKSIRRHKILTDSQILDTLGDETIERDLSVRVRTAIRGATRRAAREKRPFTDTDLFECVATPDGKRDLVDDLVESVSLVLMRQVVVRASVEVGLASEQTPPERSLMDSLAPPSAGHDPSSSKDADRAFDA